VRHRTIEGYTGNVAIWQDGAGRTERGRTMSLPIFPLNTVLFPGEPLPLRVFEDRYLRMLRDRVANDPVFGIALIDSGSEVNDQPTFHHVGTTARLLSVNVINDGLADVVVVGGRRIVLSRGDWTRGYAIADADELPDRRFNQREAIVRLGRARAILDSYVELATRLVGSPFQSPGIALEATEGSFAIAALLPMHTWQQQEMLEDRDPVSRIDRACAILRREITLLRRTGVVSAPLKTSGEKFALN
jgi:Lon protease-like protein